MLMKRDESVLLIIDIQERLAPITTDPRRVIHAGTVLMRTARRLEVPVIVTEQNPERMGPTVVDLREWMPPEGPISKLRFRCTEVDPVMARLKATGRRQVVMGGIEAHICVLQSALALAAEGYECFVVAEAAGSRRPESEEMAIARLRQAGVAVVTTEMAVFEWLGGAGTPEFRDILPLVK